MDDHILLIKQYIHKYGPILAYRVSSAQARGRAKKFAYWGAAQYEIRVAKNGNIKAVVVYGASSDRRSFRLAQKDAEELADIRGAIVITDIGILRGGDLYEASMYAWRKLAFGMVADLLGSVAECLKLDKKIKRIARIRLTAPLASELGLSWCQAILANDEVAIGNAREYVKTYNDYTNWRSFLLQDIDIESSRRKAVDLLCKITNIIEKIQRVQVAIQVPKVSIPVGNYRPIEVD